METIVRSKPSHRVVIIGGGFAGVRVAYDLAKKSPQNLEIVLVSQHNTHVDFPLLYEVATAYLPRDSATSSEHIQATAEFPLSQIFAGKKLRLIIKKVARLVLSESHVVFTDKTTIDFNTLVIAVGTRLATFNITGVAEHAFSIKTLTEALELRHHIVRQFHQGKELKGVERQSALTFVVAGAGASGVELAAELVGQARRLAVRHGIDAALPKVVLVEAGSRILSMVPEAAAERVMARLQGLGILVRVNTKITQVTPTIITLQGGGNIYARTTVWTAGLRPSELLLDSGLPITSWGVATNTDLTVQGASNVFVVGDAAIISGEEPPLPATVSVAYTQAALAVRNILHQRAGEALEKYCYTVPGMIVTLGGKVALLLLPSGKFYFGFLPWLAKQLVTLHYWMSIAAMRGAWSVWRRGWTLFQSND